MNIAMKLQFEQAMKDIASLKKTVDILASTVKALEGRIAVLEGAKRGNRHRPTAGSD